MGSFREGLTEGLRTAACVLVGGQPEFISRWLDFTTPSGLLPLANAVRQWVCGTDPSEDVPIPPPPFAGGQCPVLYDVTVSTTVFDLFGPGIDGTVVSSARVLGPIGGVVSSTTQPGFEGQGTVAVSSADGLITTSPATGTEGGTGFTITVLSVTRVDGLPDECGDPPPDLPPPSPVTIDVDVTYGPTNNFTVTVPVIFGIAYVSLDGRVNIPINVQLNPEFALNGTLEIFPDFQLDLDFNVGTNPNDDGPVGDEPPENPDQNPGDETDDPEGEDEGPAPPIFAVLTAAVIQSDARPSSIDSFVGPDIYVPRLGSVRFGTVIDGAAFLV